MRVAYLINQYPKVSHSFIRREIHALERLGLEIDRIAVRGWTGEEVDQLDAAERQRTRYVIKDGSGALLVSFFRVLLRRPLRLLVALHLIWTMSRRAERPLVVHLIYLAEACRILQWLEKERVDHLHAHFGTNSAEVALLVHELGGPPWSFTVHGPEEFDKAPIIHLAEKLRRCAFVVPISSYGRSQLFRMLDRRSWHKVHVVHCGLEASFFASEPPPPVTSRRLVCVGRLCEQKGQLLLLEAARQLTMRGAEFELVLVGDGEMRADVDAFIARHGLEQRVRVTGWLFNETALEQIRQARALVLPSFAEGLPVVLMEAMALGRPVITTYVAGIPELVEPGANGWLVPPGDVEALVAAMRACLETPVEKLAMMGAAARARVAARHDVEREAAKLAQLFAASARPAVLASASRTSETASDHPLGT
ncbi:MAG: glycosyltransferase family 4 protein [Bradyrhizobium sp.]|nr:glycosyltransferase family 4 protein [Bradyrhizobium sp.]